MIPGPLNDDRYRMVEDEFLHVAQRFTAHLHRAEYDRLKSLAKSQNEATIREIERPVVGNLEPTSRARQRDKSARRTMKQRKALEGDADGNNAGNDGRAEGDETASPWVGTSLRGLMDLPRREGKTIIPVATASSSSSRTRAAAGYSSNSQPQQDPYADAITSSPPLSASSSKRVKLEPPLNVRPATKPSVKASRYHSQPKTSTASPQASSSSIPRSGGHRRGVNNRDDDSDDDPFGLNQRRLRRKKSREQFKRPEVEDEAKEEPKKTDLSMIPSFL